MMAIVRTGMALAVFCILAVVTSADESEASPTKAPEESEDGSNTRAIMDQLTIDMTAEVIDERTFALGLTAKAGRKLVRLANVAPIERGTMSEEEYQAKVEEGKTFLRTFVDKQMILYKAAPDEHQPEKDPDAETVILADAWTTDGKFISQRMVEAGHLVANKVWEHELAKDILQAESEKSKKDAYKELEEALKENERYKREKAKEAAQQEEEEEEPSEPLGFGGWMGVVVVVILVIGVLTNFGRPTNKKVNLNKKKGMLEKFFGKLKGHHA